MDVIGVDRVFIMCEEVGETTKKFEDLLGLSFSDVIEGQIEFDKSEDVSASLSKSGLEILAPRQEDSVYGRFLSEHGPGLFGISVRVRDVDAAVEELADKGVEPIGRFELNKFTEVFYEPDNFGGAYVVLTEYTTPHPAQVGWSDLSQ
jgi:4-hydroxyphenylpyruvate dioxygenase-like putative hemolysin